MIGSTIGLRTDSDGELADIYLQTMAITHWRELPDGRIDIRGPLSWNELDWVEDLSPSEQTNLILSVPSVHFTPDKLAIETRPSTSLHFRDVRIARDCGVVVQATDAGPAILMLESLTLDDPEEPINWEYIGDSGVGDAVPATQKTGEAG